MGWVAAVILAVALIYFAIHYPGFRKALYAVAGLVVLAACAIVLYMLWDDYQNAEKRRIARSLVAHSLVDLRDFRMGVPSGYSSAYQVTGIVKNNSAYTLTSLSLAITLSNCDDEGNNCEVVGSEPDLISFVTVPPGEARQYSSSFYLSDTPPLKNWRWHSSINYVEASGEQP